MADRHDVPRRLLVVGRSGQLARCLARAKAPDGWQIVCHGREDGLDLASAEASAAAFRAEAPDVVVNAAAYTAVDRAESEPDAAYAINRDGPAALARLCAAAGIPLIHISTDYVFDGSKSGPYLEDDPIRPLGVYGASKAAGEAAVRDLLPAHVILRTSWVYSPFGTNFVKTMLRLGATRTELSVVADQRGCPTSADDLARAVLTIADRFGRGPPATYGTYHAAGSGETTWWDFARFVFASAAPWQSPPEVHPIATADYPTPASRPANSRLDCSRLSSVFGLRLPDWQPSVRACVEELCRNAETEREGVQSARAAPSAGGIA
ncbi:dTDP-4-dehydrorhamnose reductase [Faunimonas sp. B44]|uniref:dTDP-4-dehydrorhamnose reductase n=1 Tax=Faunimonas sp. B44 TaxID=3461493 RepID=UPI0040448310